MGEQILNRVASISLSNEPALLAAPNKIDVRACPSSRVKKVSVSPKWGARRKLDRCSVGRITSHQKRGPSVNKTIVQREPDGSVHYRHCYGEEAQWPPAFQRRPQSRLARLPRPQNKLRMLGAAFALATAMFWATMLTSPPTSEAGLSVPRSDPACGEAGQKLGVWFATEVQRRSGARANGHDDFNLMASWFTAARNQCASGMAERSAQNFRSLEAMIAALEERRRPGDDER